ncbi:GNAT family N-acetyltransferase [Ruminococcus albus]|uniref:Acetyltransferase (GNAT) domain-containing protein n=1 Tax=Ruminococcus albus TaxID=1264 RepID=A0A1H7JVD5_RUMAL|nr:GNAT family N-acetyltransferase [Ruminococcus albus]SEK77525.1 Acetyltransferase (GNAT) domain-containing protein [Ruminococcus albus]
MSTEKKFVFTDKITAKDYLRLREEAGWKQLAPEQAQAGLDNSFAVSAVLLEGETVGFARLLWDGGYVAYLAEVMVTEKCRHNRLATQMVEKLIERLRAEKKDGWQIKIHLMANLGRESFYEQFGFKSRPNDRDGAAMDLWL